MAFSEISNRTFCYSINKPRPLTKLFESSALDPLKLFLYIISSIISRERNKRWWLADDISTCSCSLERAKNAAGPNSREIIASVFPLLSFFPLPSSHLIHQIEKAGINNVVDANHSLADLRASRSSLHLAAHSI